MQSFDFSNVDLVQKLEIGEAFISSTRQDFRKGNKVVEDLLTTLHATIPKCQLVPNTPNTKKYKILINSLGSRAESIKNKYEKDLANDKENLL